MKKILLFMTFVLGALNLSAAETKQLEIEKAESIEEFYNIYDEISKTINQLPWERQQELQEWVYEPKLTELIIKEINKPKTTFKDLEDLREKFDVLPLTAQKAFRDKAEKLNKISEYNTHEVFKSDKEDLDKYLANFEIIQKNLPDIHEIQQLIAYRKGFPIEPIDQINKGISSDSIRLFKKKAKDLGKLDAYYLEFPNDK